MRSGIHGTFATLLLMIPVLSIPALAIFGIPQFAPVVASPMDEGSQRDRERRVGQSERPASEGILSDWNDADSDTEGLSGSKQSAASSVRIGDTVPISGARRKASEWDSAGFEQKERLDGRAGNDSWRDDQSNDDRRDSGISAGNSGSNPPANRRGFDTRFAALPADSNRTAPQPVQREQRSDLVPVERTVPRHYQREREPTASTTAPIRQVANVREPVTWQGAIQRLNELEIRNFRLERGHRENQFVFICSYTPSDSPRVSFRFEAEADEPLKAVEKVLEQIDEWQVRR